MVHTCKRTKTVNVSALPRVYVAAGKIVPVPQFVRLHYSGQHTSTTTSTSTDNSNHQSRWQNFQIASRDVVAGGIVQVSLIWIGIYRISDQPLFTTCPNRTFSSWVVSQSHLVVSGWVTYANPIQSSPHSVWPTYPPAGRCTQRDMTANDLSMSCTGYGRPHIASPTKFVTENTLPSTTSTTTPVGGHGEAFDSSIAVGCVVMDWWRMKRVSNILKQLKNTAKRW